MAHRVFLSHASKDAEAATRACTLLEAESIGCWLASRDGASRKDKAAANLEAIRTSELVLLLFSAAANTSSTVLRDIERAVAYERPVLSLHLDAAVPNPSLEYYLNLWQWFDASQGLEARKADLVAAVRQRLTGTSDSSPGQWLDALGGVEGKQEEILAAVRVHLAQTSDSASPVARARGWRRPSRRTLGIALGSTVALLALSLGLGLGLTDTAVHQGSWTQLTPSGALPHRPTVPMAYDSTTRQPIMMLQSGEHPNPFSGVETWAFDSVTNTWSELKPAGTVPPPRIGGFTMAYEPTTERLIIFGGGDRPSVPIEGGWEHYALDTTWAYDPVARTWTELRPAGTMPPPRNEGATAYDPTTQRLILFGGTTNLVFLDDTWAYDPSLNTWAELTPAGTVPRARSSKMVYDPSTGRMILFGGANIEGVSSDIWAYDPLANTWTDLNPSGPLPKGRMGFAMAYDPSRNQVIVFGGVNADGSKFFDDTWAYDPVANTWTELKPSGASPGPRISSMVYDLAAGQMVMFGVVSPGGSLNDTWAFTY